MINFDKSFKRNCDMTGILLTTNRKQKGLLQSIRIKVLSLHQESFVAAM